MLLVYRETKSTDKVTYILLIKNNICIVPKRCFIENDAQKQTSNHLSDYLKLYELLAQLRAKETHIR